MVVNNNNNNYSAKNYGCEMERASTKARVMTTDDPHREGGRLCFVVFDTVMWGGKDVSEAPYANRLQLLSGFFKDNNSKRTAAEKRKIVRLVQNADLRVQTSADLVALMREANRKGLEGYVLKDPTSPYRFERTRAVQKVKLSGPDINAGVVGVGFSLSSNPRRWGLLSAVKLWDSGRGNYDNYYTAASQKKSSDDNEDTNNSSLLHNDGEEDEERRMMTLVTYCRTEVLEGNSLYRAFQHVHKDLSSTVSISQILPPAFKNRRWNQRPVVGNLDEVNAARFRKVVELPEYKVIATCVPEWSRSMLKVEWFPKKKNTAVMDGLHRYCALVVLPDTLDDIQWLCNPFECAFSLSLKGDLRPVERPFSLGGSSSSSSSSSSRNDAADGAAGAAAAAAIQEEEEEEEEEEEAGVSQRRKKKKKKKKDDVLLLPRHPVGRVEISGYSTSSTYASSAAWDTPKTIKMKFTEAQDLVTCIETHVLRRILNLRALPAKKTNLEEIGRILFAWCTNQDEKWPQMPPGNMASIDGLSHLLKKAMQGLLAGSPTMLFPNNDSDVVVVVENDEEGASSSQQQPQSKIAPALIQSALRPLSVEERQAMAGLQARSQWAKMDNKLANIRKAIMSEEGDASSYHDFNHQPHDDNDVEIIDEDSAVNEAEAQSRQQANWRRMKDLKNLNLKPPLVIYKTQKIGLSFAAATDFSQIVSDNHDHHHHSSSIDSSSSSNKDKDKDTIGKLLDNINFSHYSSLFTPHQAVPVPLVGSTQLFQECSVHEEEDNDYDQQVYDYLLDGLGESDAEAEAEAEAEAAANEDEEDDDDYEEASEDESDYDYEEASEDEDVDEEEEAEEEEEADHYNDDDDGIKMHCDWERESSAGSSEEYG